MVHTRNLLLCVTVTMGTFSCTIPPGSGDRLGDAALRVEAARFVTEHEARIRPLEKAVSLAWWQANISGRDEDFKAKEEAQNQLDAALSDPARFAELKRIHEALPPSAAKSPSSAPDLLARQIHVLYLQYLEKQVDPELLRKMSAKGNAVEKAFNVYRAKVNNVEMADSEVRRILRQSKNSTELRAVWEASKGVGPVVEADLKDLVKLRNEAARKLGHKNYHVLQLHLNEQSQEQVLKLFDDLWALLREPFQKAKAELDGRLASDCGIQVSELRPWHYQDPFFQESPAVFTMDLDSAYTGVDILKLCREFYTGIGLPVEDVLARSDLYEKKGKSPHAFCTDIDREGDVRVLANIVPTEYWMGTMLHELGHAVYSSKNMPSSVPYVLRTEANSLSTEGIAMMFERLSKSGDWLQAMGVKLADLKAFNETGAQMHRNHLLIFAAWCQVMFRFEVAMYDEPDQDLGKLWWDLVEKYQMVHRPDGRSAPDYAAKIHVVTAPAYYHNYMMGQLFACQVHHAIARDVLKASPAGALYNGKREVGEFLNTKIFGMGRILDWNSLARHATGEDLNAKAFAEDVKG